MGDSYENDLLMYMLLNQNHNNEEHEQKVEEDYSYLY